MHKLALKTRRILVAHQVLSEATHRENKRFIEKLRGLLHRPDLTESEITDAIDYISSQFDSLNEKSDMIRAFARRELERLEKNVDDL